MYKKWVGLWLMMSLFIFLAAGCNGDDDDEEIVARDATIADLQDRRFSFTTGAALDQQMFADQAVRLEFGDFDASGTAPFTLLTNGMIATGIATLQSPLTLTFLQVDEGLPFAVNEEISFDADTLVEDNNEDRERLRLTNTETAAISTSDFAVDAPNPPIQLLAISLRGSQEVPAVLTDASGSAALSLNTDPDAEAGADIESITYTLSYTGFTTNVTQAHIHVAQAGVNGPIILFLCTNLANAPTADTPVCPVAEGTVTGTLTAANFIPREEVGVTTFAEAVEALRNGNTYVNVHTETNPAGEIRGQMGPAELQATLSGVQEVPPVTTLGSGSATVRLSNTQTALAYELIYENLTDVMQAHIHTGAVGENGPIVLFLCTNGTPPANVPMPPTCPASAGTVMGTLTNDDLILDGADPEEFGVEVINALLSGNTYANVHTQANPAGEIRGQLAGQLAE